MKFLRLVLAGPRPELIFTQYGIYVISGPHMAYYVQNLPHVRQPFTIDPAHLPARVTQASYNPDAFHAVINHNPVRATPALETARKVTLLLDSCDKPAPAVLPWRSYALAHKCYAAALKETRTKIEAYPVIITTYGPGKPAEFKMPLGFAFYAQTFAP